MQSDIQIISAAISDRGLSEKRPENEDSFLVIDESGIFAVADGVGGAQAGDVASQMAMEIVGEAFINLANQNDAEDVMRTAIERANEAIFQMSNELPQLSTMATTIVALHINGNIATIGHVGDSRLYRIDSNGALFRETQDHSVVEEEVRAGRMTPEQAANHPSRNIISRALGAEPSVDVDLKTIMFEPNTTFLICSDGITRHITDDEINVLLFSAHHPQDICRRMKEICYDRGAEDNLTAVIVRALEQPAHVQTEPADFEQETVAAARQPLAATAGFSDSGSIDVQSSPQNLAGQNYETSRLDSEIPPSVPSAQPQVETFTTEQNVTKENVRVAQDDVRPVVSYEEEKTGGGFFGKLIGGLALLLLGLVLGAAGYHQFAQREAMETAPPVVENEAALEENPLEPVISFESARRRVDENPAQYIKASGITPDNAEDYYLLGRAHLLQKDYPKAKENFIEAKNRLASVNNDNSQMLATEIALGLAVINGQFSLREFEKELPAMQTEQTNTNAATNSGSNAPPSLSGQMNGADIQ